MNKYFAALSLGLLLVPSLAFAQSSQPDQSAILALLNTLMQEVQSLEMRLTALESEQASTTPVLGVIIPVATSTSGFRTAIDMSQSPLTIETQENAECLDYTEDTPFKEEDGWYTPVIGSMCLIQPGGGRECGC